MVREGFFSKTKRFGPELGADGGSVFDWLDVEDFVYLCLYGPE